MLLLTAILVALVGVLYYSGARAWQRRFLFKGEGTGLSQRSLVGPPLLPFIGNALWMISLQSFLRPRIDVLRSLERISAGYARSPEGMVLFWLGNSPFLIVLRPNICKEILQTKARSFYKGVFASSMSPLMGQGLLLIDGDRWRVHHRLVSPPYQNFRSALPGIVSCNLALQRRWKRHAFVEVDICHEFSRLTLDSIGVLAFGKHFGAIDETRAEDASVFHEVAVVLREMQRECERLYPELHKALVSSLPSGLHQLLVGTEFQDSTAKVHQLVRKRMEERRMELKLLRESNQGPSDGDAERKASLLLDAVLDGIDKGLLTDSEAQDELVTAVMGGHETTASLMSWVTVKLLEHPNVLEKVRQEVDSLFERVRQRCGEQGEISMDWQDLDELPLLSSVVHETLRLYPSAPVLNRQSTEEIQIGDWEIPRGTQILIPSWTIHRDPTYWPDPLAFVPERWDEGWGKERERGIDSRTQTEGGSTARRHTQHHEHLRQQFQQQFIFLPFGAGPRKCLGQQFAILETKLAIALLLKNFDLSALSSEPWPDPEMAITLRCRNGFRVRLQPR